ncbi:MAG: metalloregulator ArsR/SmtB family transcription factor [Syntrophomonas sp.]
MWCEVYSLGKVNKVIDSMINEDITSSLVDIFKAMADCTRLKILYSLMQTELCVFDLAAVTGASESAVSHQLRILRSYKLIKFRREGKKKLANKLKEIKYMP